MKLTFSILYLAALPLAAQPYKSAVVSMLHTHVFGHLGTVLKSDQAKFVGISETLPELVERAKRSDNTRPGVPDSLTFSDWKKMIDETKPDFVWAFTPTNEHLAVVRYCAPRGIHVIMLEAAGSYGFGQEIQWTGSILNRSCSPRRPMTTASA